MRKKTKTAVTCQPKSQKTQIHKIKKQKKKKTKEKIVKPYISYILNHQSRNQNPAF